MSGGGRLQGRVALITGGTQGIGRATAVRLAREGARLAIVGRTPERVRETADFLSARVPGAEILPLTLDVRSEADMQEMARATVERFGCIDILIACAGILRAPGTSPKMVRDLPPDEWDQVIDVNLKGVFLSNRAVLPVMMRQRRGDIVNLSSRSGREGVAFDAPYSASKFGVVGLTESLAEEARPYGVRVQAILPGTFDSEVWSQNGPLPRPADLPPVDRIADLVLMLVTLPVDTCLAPVLIEPVGASRKLVGRRATAERGESTDEAPAGTVPQGGRLDGRVVVITGGAGGIGLATARAVAAAGGAVVLADLDEARVASAVAGLPRPAADGPGPHLGLACDVRSEEDNARLARKALERFGRIDALVVCAGILRGRGGLPRPMADLSLDEWRQVIDVNLKGMYLSNRAVLPALIERRRGTILNLSSVSGLRGRAHDAAYCASKFGVIGLSQSLHAEVRRYGVRVQAILPDVVDTALWDQNGPVPRPGDALPPERVADLVLFMLAQPDDTTLVAPVIAPLRARRLKAAAAVLPAAIDGVPERLLDPFEARRSWR